MATVTIETPDGNKTELLHACGLTYSLRSAEYLPYGTNLTKHIEDVQDLDIREDDIYLATYPKCGTHWAWEIIAMLQKGEAKYETNAKEALFLDFTKASVIDAKPSPRILNGHYPCRLTPKGMFEKRTKIVHVMRNPKDAFVSLYYHYKATNSHLNIVKDFKTFLPFTLGDYGISFFYPFFEYVMEWEKFTQENPDMILNLFYEDMKEDPVREIKKIDKFLGTNRDDKLIEQIAKACDFQNLKKADVEVKVKDGRMRDELSFMYRKGEVGDWKNHFTVSMNELMDKWIEEKSSGSGLIFRYTI